MTFLHSIRWRLTLWYALVFGVTIIGAGITAYFITRSTMLDNLDRSLRNEVKWVNEFIEPRAKRIPLKRAALRELEELKRSAAAQSEDTEQDSDVSDEERAASDEMWEQIYQHTLLSPRRHFIQILDRNGDLLYRSQSLRGLAIRYDEIPYQWINVVTTQLPDGEEIRLALMQNNYVKIFVAYPLEPVQEVLDSVFANILLIVPIALLISIIGGWFLANKSLKPVDNLTRAAREITAQNLNRRLPPLRGDDELGRLTGQFNDMIGRLQASFEQVRQFSVDASHELRTPLTIMRGEIEVALRNARLSRTTREIFESVLHEVIRLSSIVESLVILTKAETGRQAFTYSAVALDQLVRQIADDARVLAEPKRIRVKEDRIDRVTITADGARLRQLLLTLVDNAVKYTPERGSVTLSLVQDGTTAHIRVKDTGIGIPRKDQSRVFERFYRVERDDGSRGTITEGSGLGLSIARWIAEAHDGTITVESRERRGSTFTVSLPLAPPAKG